MILPTLALVAKPIACSLTDAHGIHKQFLIGSLTVFGLSYGSLGVLPFIRDINDRSTDFITWVIISIIMSIGYVSVGCIFCMQDALASNYARKHDKSYGRMRAYACAGWATGALLVMVVGEVSWLPFRVVGIIILVTAIVIDILILVLWPYPEDFEMFHDGSTSDERKLSIVGPNTVALMAQNNPRGSISRDVLEHMRGRSKSVGGQPKSDQPELSLTNFTTSKDNNCDGGLNEKKDKEVEEEKKEYSNFQCQMILMKMIATQHKSFIRYIVLFTLYGLIQSMIWNYQLDYFKKHIVKDDAEFEFISTLCMIAQSVFGEIAINLVASQMLKAFGSNANLSLALVAIGLRCFYYSNLLPYLGTFSVVFAEALQGPSLGLYWVLIVDIGSNYALMVSDYLPELRRRGVIRDRQHEEELKGCLRATMIGVMSSSMEGLGVALGSLLGGIISAKYGYNLMWNLCAGIGFTAGFVNVGWDLATKLLVKKNSRDDKANNMTIPTVVVEESTLKLSKGTKL